MLQSGMGRIKLAPQQCDNNGLPLAGGRLYFSSPVFCDEGFTIEHPNPIILDQHGLTPPLYAKPSIGDLAISLKDYKGEPIWSIKDVKIM